MIGNFLSNAEKPLSYVKTAVTTFYPTFGNISLQYMVPLDVCKRAWTVPGYKREDIQG